MPLFAHQGILEALEHYGEELEVLDLAGCHHLLAPKVFRSIRRWCKRLVFLDLSSRTDPTARLRGGGDFDVSVRGLVVVMVVVVVLLVVYARGAPRVFAFAVRNIPAHSIRWSSCLVGWSCSLVMLPSYHAFENRAEVMWKLLGRVCPRAFAFGRRKFPPTPHSPAFVIFRGVFFLSRLAGKQVSPRVAAGRRIRPNLGMYHRLLVTRKSTPKSLPLSKM